MALKELRVDSLTLSQIADVVERDPQGQNNLKRVIIESVDKLWRETCEPKTTLVLIDETNLEVLAKPAYQETLKKLTGVDGPYKVTKTCKSWVGLSDGVYQLVDCPILTPVSWFAIPEEKKWSDQTSRFIMYFLALMSLLQSICLLLLLL